MKKIEQDIKAVRILNETPKENNPKLPSLIDLKRPDVLSGKNYKIKPPNAKAATYVNINNILVDVGTENERLLPYELFINSKDVTHHQWMAAMTRTFSAVFRQEMDCGFLIDEYKEVIDPDGGGYLRKGVFIPSLVAEIGMVIEKHLDYVNEINTRKDKNIEEVEEIKYIESDDYPPNAEVCKVCKSKAVMTVENCPKCLHCGDSKCG